MRLAAAFLITAAVPLCASSPLPPGVGDPGAPGPYEIGHTAFLVVDTSRNTDGPFGGRPVPVNVWYPADASAINSGAEEAIYPLDPIFGNWPSSTSSEWEAFGMARAYEDISPAPGKPFPLVLFSPGSNARYYGYLFYAERLASHGLVVAVTHHYRDGTFPWDPPDTIGETLLNRPRDVSVMLDAVLARNADPESILFNSVRPDLVAASGHSLGGYAALTLAGGDDAVCAIDVPLTESCESIGSTPPDPRIKVIIPLDGSNQYLHFAELARITIPSMAIGTPWERVEDWQARQHAAISGHPNYRADVRDAVHNSFTNSCTSIRLLHSKGLMTAAQFQAGLNRPECVAAIPQPEVNRLAAQYAIAFLKPHLEGVTGYQNILTPGWALTVEQYIEFFVTEKTTANAVDEEWPGWFTYFPHQPGSARERAERDPAKLRPLERVEW